MKKVLSFPSPTNQPVEQAVTRALSNTCVFAPGKAYIVECYEEQRFVLEYTLDMEREGPKMDLDLHTFIGEIDETGTGQTNGYRWPTAAQTTKEQADAIIKLLSRIINEWPYEDIPVKLVRALTRYEIQMKVGQIDRVMGVLKTEI